MPPRPATGRHNDFWRQLDAASRWVFPAAMLVCGLFLLGLPLHMPGQAWLRPAYAMGCVYFWSLYRPAALPIPVTGLAGLLLDLMGITPPGLWALLLILLQTGTMLARRRLAPRRFAITWAAFGGFAALTVGMSWGVQALLSFALLPLWPAALELLLAISLYPALAVLLIRAHRGPAAVELA